MQHLILLHGALGAKQQLQPLAAILQNDFSVHTLNFHGHGGEVFGKADFSTESFADDVLVYMQQQNIERASFFGYSMGGYVAMYIAKYFADKVEKIITLATKFHWDETIAAREVKMLNPDVMLQKVPAYAEALQQRHAPNDWKIVLQKTADMMNGLGANNTLKLEDYASIHPLCLIMLGDRDKMVTLDETISVYKQMPNAQMAMLPATPHPLEQVNTELVSYFMKRFL